MSYRVTYRARQDVAGIWNYIAADSEGAADRFVDLIVRHFEALGENPHIGRTREELRPHLRSFPVGDYLIFYRAMKPGAVILRVVHGRRNLELLF